MKENKFNNSEFAQYQFSGDISSDTQYEAGVSVLEQIRNISEGEIIFQGPMHEKPSIFPESDKQINIMRQFLETFYEKVLDAKHIPDSEKPHQTLKSLPRKDIKGTKDEHEYVSKRLKKTDKALRDYRSAYGDATSFFQDNSPLACEITVDGKKIYSLMRGHHEVRKAGSYHLDEIPTQVITVEDLASALNRYDKPPKQIGRVTPESLTGFFTHQMKVAEASFRAAKAAKTSISNPAYH